MPLVESDIKALIQHSLLKCHQKRMNYYSYILNIVLFMGIVIGLVVFFYVKLKYRPSANETYEKMRKERDRILSRIRHYQEQQHIAASHISELPVLQLKPDNIQFAIQRATI